MKGSGGLKSPRAIYVLTALLAAAIVLEVLRRKDGVLWVDLEVFRAVVPDKSTFVQAFSYSDSLESIALLAAIMYFIDAGLHRSVSRQVVSFAVAIIFAMIVTAILKAYIMVPRPLEPPAYFGLLGNLINADYFAFPSGHAVRVTVLAYYIMAVFKTRKSRLSYLAAVYAAAIMYSRLLLQVHWLSDLVAGLIVGLWSSALVEGPGAKVWVWIYNHTFGLIPILRLRV